MRIAADLAERMGVTLLPLVVDLPDDLPAAIGRARDAGAHALMTTQGPYFALHARRIADLALRHRMPMLTGEAPAAAAGSLLFYGPDIPAGCREGARYVQRLLAGAEASDLPVSQAPRVVLIVNARTADRLGLRLPASLLQRADEVIR
jgi:putative ABC transport system substrate-binding protein